MSSEQNLDTFQRFSFWIGKFFDNNRLLQMPRQRCLNFAGIAQKISRANIEQKHKFVRNSSNKAY